MSSPPPAAPLSDSPPTSPHSDSSPSPSARLDAGGSELFGRGGKDGLLDLLQAQGGGTLLINDAHQVGGGEGGGGRDRDSTHTPQVHT